ncbi:MAG: hypothetical protein GF401_16025 [Chitinivibrionales bacterium]|nr:hypothetical protein [Chitinivibrionales bacterium]
MRYTAAAVAIALLLTYQSKAQTTIQASRPTHYFYTPAPYVNEPYHLVIGLHEISFALPANLQLQASLLDNIGRINLGAKYGIMDNMSVGAGLAHSLVHLGRGNHGIPNYASPRLGVFFVYGFLMREKLESAFTLHTQIGERVSAGIDFGLLARVHEVWSLIWEIGSSVDFEDELLYLNTDGGVRINPPSIPFLFFDFGIDLEEFPVAEGASPTVTAYIDVLFTMQVR